MYLLGYDIGSSSVKTALVDATTGRCVASCFFPEKEAPIKALRPGWAEQNPDSWWMYLKEGTARVLRDSGVDASDIRAIGISYQMHGLVVVDTKGRPLRDAIIWCDSRAVAIGEEAFESLGPDRITSHLLNSPGNFTAAKLAWVKRNEPALFARIYKVMLPGEYIAMRLTGEVVTTPEGLSEQILWDFRDNAPSVMLMDYFGFSPDLFGEVRPTFSNQGHLTAEAALELGLRQGTPVSYRAGDQPNNALSLNVFNPGEIASTGGTSGVVYGVTDSVKPDSKSRVNTFVHVNHTAAAPRLGILACINGCGILNSWMKRNVALPGLSYEYVNGLAATVPVGSDGLSILPFGNGAERLLENRTPGASVCGLEFTRHGRNHMLRASQEGIAFAFVYGMEIMEEMGLKVDRIHAAHANLFLSPVFRDTFASTSGATIQLYETDGAVGAALGAGVGAGIYASTSEAFATLRQLGRVAPAADRTPYLDAYAIWRSRLVQTQ